VLKSVPYKDKYMIGKGLFQHAIPGSSGLSYLILKSLFIGHLINVPLFNHLMTFICSVMVFNNSRQGVLL
jgi:hypothetical protein